MNKFERLNEFIELMGPIFIHYIKESRKLAIELVYEIITGDIGFNYFSKFSQKVNFKNLPMITIKNRLTISEVAKELKILDQVYQDNKKEDLLLIYNCFCSEVVMQSGYLGEEYLIQHESVTEAFKNGIQTYLNIKNENNFSQGVKLK